VAPQDFKQRPARKAPPRQPRRNVGGARWPWFGAGACVGALATAALLLYEPGTSPPGAGTRAAAPEEPPAAPRFEFYTLLPEKEIAIPEAELDAPPPAPAARAAAPSSAAPAATASAPAAQPRTDGERYLLQVGSFRKLEDADRLKARLAFMGLESTIQTVSIDGAETWHRVRVGPFIGRSALDRARATLKQNKFESMALKLK
jgi:cell division protein FtsN